MKPGVKLAAFALVLAAAFGGGAALGAVFEPSQPAPEPMEHNTEDMSNMTEEQMREMGHLPTTTTRVP